MGIAPGDRTRVVIVDDHAVFSRGLQLLLDAAPGDLVEVKGTTEDASEAAWLAERHQAHVALVDIQMPPPGGLAAIAAIKERCPDCCVVVLSGVEDPEVGVAALRAGADGYIVKSADPEELLPPILSAASGMAVTPSWLLGHLLREGGAEKPDLSHLDDEELVILRLICSGADTSEIASTVHVSDRTAKRMIASLLRHMGVANRVEAAVVAALAGVVGHPAAG